MSSSALAPRSIPRVGCGDELCMLAKEEEVKDKGKVNRGDDTTLALCSVQVGAVTFRSSFAWHTWIIDSNDARLPPLSKAGDDARNKAMCQQDVRWAGGLAAALRKMPFCDAVGLTCENCLQPLLEQLVIVL